MTDLPGPDLLAPGAMEAWRRHLGEDVDAEALDAHVRERLSAYKCPKRFVEIEELPRNELGKVQKDELVRAAEEEVRAGPSS